MEEPKDENKRLREQLDKLKSMEQVAIVKYCSLQGG